MVYKKYKKNIRQKHIICESLKNFVHFVYTFNDWNLFDTMVLIFVYRVQVHEHVTMV